MLFIGLAAVTARGGEGMLRAVVAGLLVAAAAFVVPALHDYSPILAALVVAPLRSLPICLVVGVVGYAVAASIGL